MNNLEIKGNLIDVFEKRIYPAVLSISNGVITAIKETTTAPDQYILPGFIDAHVHIESSMMIPSEFARLAVVHGTVATVSDPHEIANVLGVQGVEFMIENGKSVPFKFYFGAPSCVPATRFETAGAEINATEIETLFKNPDILYLAEMMNWPGVLYKDRTVWEKIELAKKYNKLIDGHAPGLVGEQAKQYAAAGITTDHECFTLEEALQKLECGMKILIREGSAAKNFDALIDLLNDYEDKVMFCSDDKHPDNLVEGHVDQLVKRALHRGIDLFKVLKAATVNPVLHYKLPVGLLRINDPADFIIIDNPTNFNILKTYISGALVAENKKTLIPAVTVQPLNKFYTSKKIESDFRVDWSQTKVRVIEAIDGQLITKSFDTELEKINNQLQPDRSRDILKITVVNRYQDTKPSVSFIKGFGLKEGALASSIAHDSHNIVAVGVDDKSLTSAVNEVIKNKGGIAAIYQNQPYSLPLPVAGLMSAEDGYLVAEKYSEMDKVSKLLGSPLSSPFMTLSFMALLVIPSLKLSDLGLFDGDKFELLGNNT